MTDFQRINNFRPLKIIAMLDVIEASARSQKATPEEVRALLAPVYEKLGAVNIPAPVVDVPAPGVITTHDGNTIVALKACLRRGTPDEVRAALEWCIKHNVTAQG